MPALIAKATKVPGWHVEGYDLDADRFRRSIEHVDALGKSL